MRLTCGFPLQLVKGLSKPKHRSDQPAAKTSSSGVPAAPEHGDSKELGGVAREALDLMAAGMRKVRGSLDLRNCPRGEGQCYLLL